MYPFGFYLGIEKIWVYFFIFVHINEKFITLYIYLSYRHLKNSRCLLYVILGIWKFELDSGFLPFPVHSRIALCYFLSFQSLIQKERLNRGKRGTACLSPLWGMISFFSNIYVIFVLQSGDESQMGRHSSSSVSYPPK